MPSSCRNRRLYTGSRGRKYCKRRSKSGNSYRVYVGKSGRRRKSRSKSIRRKHKSKSRNFKTRSSVVRDWKNSSVRKTNTTPIRTIQTSPDIRKTSPYTQIPPKINKPILQQQLQLPVTDFIEGAMSLSLHKKDDKIIYIFGDIHRRGSCGDKKYMTITNYIKDILLQEKIQIDFFLEAILKKKYYRNEQDIDKLRLLTQNPSIFKKNRIHYIDIRHKLGNLTTLFDILNNLFDDAIYNNVSIKDLIINYSDNISVSELNKLIQSDIDYIDHILIESYDIINKELSKINPLYAEQLLNVLSNRDKQEIEDYYNEFVLSVYSLTSEYKIVFDDDDDINRSFRYLLDMLSILAVNLTDIYGIARLLKNYIKNTIVYTGDTHAKNYRTILDLIGFTKVKEIYLSEEEKYTKCLDMRNFPQPFFENI
jgi:hypothetical protein